MSWQTVRIGDVADVMPGFAFKSKELGETGIGILKIGNITNTGTVDTQNCARLPESFKLKKHEKFRVHDGDILLAMTGATAGKAGRARIREIEEFYLNQRVAKFIPRNIHPDFLWFAIGNEKYRAKFHGLGGGAAQPNMSGPQIAAVEIDLPDFKTQEKIANILSAYDDLIENNRRRIELLEKFAHLIYREWFVHFRFPGHETAKFEKGLPVGWEVKPLGEIASTNKRSHKKGKLPAKINYIDIGSVTAGSINETTEYQADDAPGRARRIAEHTDTIWSNVRPNLRAYSLVMSPKDNDVFSTGFTVLHAETVSPYFLYLATTNDEFVGHLVNHATGASYPAVRPDDFEIAEMTVPDNALMKQFHQLCEPSFKQRLHLMNQNQTLSKARDLLLPRLMDGRLSV